MQPNTLSTTQQVWHFVTQIIHFSGGQKKTFHNIDTTSIKDGTFTKMRDSEWRLIMVNGNNVDCIEVIKEEE